jgi:hypothetical protein
MRGSAPTRRTPRQLGHGCGAAQTGGSSPGCRLPCGRHTLALMLDCGTGLSVGGIVLNHSSRCIRIAVVLGAMAIMVAGCADSRMGNATSNTATGAQASGEAPYHTAYGITSDGPTTDLYTELFGSSRRDDATVSSSPPPAQPMTASAPTQQVQPVTAAASPQQVQPTTASATNRQRATASAANRQVQPAPAPLATTQVAQQPVAAPEPPPEPDTPAAYGITSNGPTTDVYTALFGPRRRDGQ